MSEREFMRFITKVARDAYRGAVADAEPDEEYMREVAADLARGETPVRWMTVEGFFEMIAQDIELALMGQARALGEAPLELEVRGESPLAAAVASALRVDKV